MELSFNIRSRTIVHSSQRNRKTNHILHSLQEVFSTIYSIILVSGFKNQENMQENNHYKDKPNLQKRWVTELIYAYMRAKEENLAFI